MSVVKPMEQTPPTELYIGKSKGQWPVQAFTSQGHALDWLANEDPSYPRRLWKVKLTDHREYVRVVQQEHLEEKE